MKTAGDLLNDKGGDVWSIGPDASVYESIEMMAEKGCGALAVVEGPNLVGIVSERDYARKVILKGRQSRETPIRDIMSSKVICCRPERTVDECMAVMTDKRIRHLPIHDGETVVGMLSLGDLVKAVIAEQKFQISQLESYIQG